MTKADGLSVFIDKGGDAERAERFALDNGLSVSDVKTDGFTINYGIDGVSLSFGGLSFSGDFSRLYRRVSGGRLMHEMLVHTAKTAKKDPVAFDLTAGMGEDSFLLSAYGYRVIMFERDPVIAELLSDALERGKRDPMISDIVSRMELVFGDSIELALSVNVKPDLIYLDPMFPEKQKSSLTNKKLQLIQMLERPCSNGSELLDTAFTVHPERIIIKRPLRGEPLGDRKPSYTVSGKAIRFDCFYLGK